MTIDPVLFRETLGHYPTGVAVVTAIAEDGNPAGMVVGTFSSVSMDPPLIAFFPARSSRTFQYLRTATTFCVNVLASDQEQVCRQLATGGAAKFDGVGWRPGPLGSPILHDAVSWIECTFDDILEAGDHYIVLGHVQKLAVERSTLPLLFFQGGYGRFSPRSFVATPEPDLIQAAQLAETIRAEVEDFSAESAANCSVLVKVGGDAVQVMSANRSPIAEPVPLGHRLPIIPPLGAVFLLDAPAAEIDEWLGRAPDEGNRREIYRARLERVREWGYSVLAADPELLERHQAALDEFERSDRLPRLESGLQQTSSELAELFCPEFEPGRHYDIASIVVPIAVPAGVAPMAIRVDGLARALATEEIEASTQRLAAVAATATAAMTGNRQNEERKHD